MRSGWRTEKINDYPTMKLDLREIAIKVKVLQDKKLQAIISLDFGGEFVVKGFRVQSSEFTNYKGDNLWLTPPSYKGGVKWHPIFFMPDKEKWKELEMRIWDEFYRERDQFFKKFHGLKDDDLSGF